jgi:hypothetical protein
MPLWLVGSEYGRSAQTAKCMGVCLADCLHVTDQACDHALQGRTMRDMSLDAALVPRIGMFEVGFDSDWG